MDADETLSSQGIKWTHNSTKLFIDCYKKHKNEVGSYKVKNFKKMWSVIAEELNTKYSLNVNAANCENRWRVLERNFRKFVNNNNKTGRGRKNFEFSEEMFDILGKNKNITNKTLLESDTTEHSPELDTLQQMRNDRKEYYEKKLKIDQEILEIEKEKLKCKKRKTILMKERNDLLRLKLEARKNV